MTDTPARAVERFAATIPRAIGMARTALLARLQEWPDQSADGPLLEAVTGFARAGRAEGLLVEQLIVEIHGLLRVLAATRVSTDRGTDLRRLMVGTLIKAYYAPEA